MRTWIGVLCVLTTAWISWGGDGEQWASDPTRNMAMEVAYLPDRLDEDNLLWRVELRGRMMYGQPTIAGGGK